MEKMGNILIVDDELGVRESFRYLLKDKYNLHIFESGEEAISFIKPGSIDVALLDIKMPGLDGLEVLKRLKSIDPDIEVIMITGFGTLESAQQAIKHGASGYICKPFDKCELENLIREKMSLCQKKREEKRKLEDFLRIKKELDETIKRTYSYTLESLLMAINAKDAYTSSHSQEVARYAYAILEGLGFNEMDYQEREIFRYMVSLHDIGKIGVSENILRKKGRLNPQEWAEVKKHPIIGAEIVKPIPFLHKFLPIVLYHHERFDGSGYPEGRKGEEIPYYARIVAIADAYHAMRSDRPYRKAFTKERALEELKKGAGKQFDPQILVIALKILEGLE